ACTCRSMDSGGRSFQRNGPASPEIQDRGGWCNADRCRDVANQQSDGCRELLFLIAVGPATTNRFHQVTSAQCSPTKWETALCADQAPRTAPDRSRDANGR